MSTSLLTKKIEEANSQGRKALIPFLPGGFPDRDRFWEELEALDAGGADVIEIGVPFSDPVADGPVVEEASLDCLREGVCLSWILHELELRKEKLSAAIVLMGYYNPFFQYGLKNFARDAAKAGVSGIIVPDLPLDEAADFKEALQAQGIDLVFLVGLNTSAARLDEYAKAASGFVYFVSVLGTTGVRETLPEEIAAKLAAARKHFSVPMALGFGIKTPEQLTAFGDSIDAVVFGSALIKHIREDGSAASFMAGWR